jgi:RecB family endonuclease NucS
MGNVRLQKTETSWKFESETVLEDFVYGRLDQLLGLTCLNRQFAVNGQYCDILATNVDKQLAIIELKNCEDRYIIQQLTRYYHAVLDAKPFQHIVDYEKQVLLIAIAPSFHRDSLIDCEYSTLNFDLNRFQLVQNKDIFAFKLTDLKSEKFTSTNVPYQLAFDPELPIPPTSLSRILRSCIEPHRKRILKIREKLLKFDKRMQETAEDGGIKYGRGRRTCLEVYLDSTRNPALILSLPRSYWDGDNSVTARMRLWTDWNRGVIVRPVRGSKIEPVTKSEIDIAIREKGFPLDKLIDDALKHWCERMA